MATVFSQQDANVLCSMALRNINVTGRGQNPNGQQLSDCLYLLNEILDSWNNKGIMIYAMNINQYALTTPAPNGTSTSPMGPYYTLGPGGDLDTGSAPRPVNITIGTFSIPGSSTENDLPMIPLTADEYSAVRAKKTASNVSTYYYYEPSFPLGKVYFWPIPNVGTTVKFTSYNSLPTTLVATSSIVFPAGYAKALRYELIMSVAGFYAKPMPQDIASVYSDIKNDIAVTNIAQRIGKFKYPSNMPGSNGVYNIFTDEGGN